MKNKKVVVLGGGTGLSTLLKGLKLFPLDISAVVSVSDAAKLDSYMQMSEIRTFSNTKYKNKLKMD